MTHVIDVDYHAELAASRQRRDEEIRRARLESRALVLLRRGWAQARAELEREAASNYPNATDEEREAAVREAMRLQIEGRGARRCAEEVTVTPPERPIRWAPSRKPSPARAPAPEVTPAEQPDRAGAGVGDYVDGRPSPAESLPASNEQQEARMANVVEVTRAMRRTYTPDEKTAVRQFVLRVLESDPLAQFGAVLARLDEETGVQMPKGTFIQHWTSAREAYEKGERAEAGPETTESTALAAEGVARLLLPVVPEAPGHPSSPEPAASFNESGVEGVAASGVVGLTTYVTARGSLNAEATANGAMRVQLDLRTGDPGLYSILVGVGMRALLQPEVAHG